MSSRSGGAAARSLRDSANSLQITRCLNWSKGVPGEHPDRIVNPQMYVLFHWLETRLEGEAGVHYTAAILYLCPFFIDVGPDDKQNVDDARVRSSDDSLANEYLYTCSCFVDGLWIQLQAASTTRPSIIL